MTVESATASASYTGNGSTTVFTVPFYFLVDTDLKVTRKSAATGLITTLVLNSDYTLTGAGSSGGGSLTTSPALPNLDEIYIERNVVAVQETAYPSNSPFPSASHERALDRLTMLVQQVKAAFGFALQKTPLGATYDAGGNTVSNLADGVAATDAVSKQQMESAVAGAAGGVLPSSIALLTDLISTAAGKGAALIGYASGTVKSALDALASTYTAIADLASTASGKGSALVGFLQAGTGASARTVQIKLRERVSVKDFGAIGDGNSHPLSNYFATLAAAQVVYPHATALTNEIDWCAIQAAVNYFKGITTIPRGAVLFPFGFYLCDQPVTASQQAIGFYGESRRSAAVQFADGVNGFVISTTVDSSASTTNHQEIAFVDLEIRTLNTGTTATAISVTNSVTTGSIPVPQLIVTRCSILPQNGFNNGWANGIYASSVSGATITDSFIVGKYNTTVGKGIYFTNYSIDNTVVNTRVLYWDVGIQDDHLGQASHGSEGLWVTACIIVNCNRGVYRGQSTGLSDPLVFVTGSHINCRVYCVYTFNIYNIVITGNLFYVQGTATQTMDPNAFCVWLDNNAPADNPVGATVTGNGLAQLGATTQSPGGVYVNLPYTTVTGNVFTGFASGIVIASNNGVLGGNQYPNCTNQINNVSGSTWDKLTRTALPAGVSSE